MGTVIGTYLFKYSNTNASVVDSESSDSDITDSADEEFQESSSEDDHIYTWHPTVIMSEHEDSELTFDAASTGATNMYASKTTAAINLEYIQSNLEYYEKVALIFLLEDDANRAIELFDKDNFLEIWSTGLSMKQNGINWREKLLEALCLIQNYEILKQYGNKTDFCAQFLPNVLKVNVNISKYRKFMYFLCEQLRQEEVQRILNAIRADFYQKGLHYKDFACLYLELHLLHWESLGYISTDNLDNLYKKLKECDLLDLCEKLKEILMNNNRPKTERIKFEKLLDDNVGLSELNSLQNSSDANSNSPAGPSNIFLDADVGEDVYAIDKEYPGVCMIINQEKFYKEKNPQYKHLMPKNENPLERRWGTEKDRDDLVQTFRNFNYRTIVENNLTHVEMINRIETVVQNVLHDSSLIVCILSHGEEGVVFGVNSCAVEVTTLQRIICSGKHLERKPKVLILQSCQGDRCQLVRTCDEDLVVDGPTRSLPLIVDLFTFWATVPGYSAIRNKKKGSWFIQSLCHKLKKLSHSHHFEDICTNIVQEVSVKKWSKTSGDFGMVPEKRSTFTKKFFLPAN